MNWPTLYLASTITFVVVLTAVYLYGRRVRTDRERSDRRSRLLLEITTLVNSTLDLDHILETTTEQMVSVFDVDHSGVVLLDDAKTYCRVVAEYPSNGATEEKLPVAGYTVIERLLADPTPLVIEDTWSDPRMEAVEDTMRRLDIRSMLIVPLIVRGEVAGSIGLDAVGQTRHFSDEEVNLAQTIAHQVAIAMENAHLYERERRQGKQASLLNTVAQQVNDLLTPEQLLPAVAEAIHEHFSYDSVILMLLDPKTEDLVIAGRAGMRAGILPLDFRQSIDQGIIGWVARHGEILLANDTSQEERYFAPFPQQYHAGAELAVPLKIGGETVGVLDLQCEESGSFDELSISTAETLAEQISTALQNARLYEETQKRAIQLETASEVARSATAILDVDQLLDETAHLISDAFDFYHAGIFLVDQQGEYAVLHAASSEGGQRMLEQGHQLPAGEIGIVGYVADTGEPRIALDVGEDAVHFANPDLPDTRSEMALPLISRGKIIGVLDVQSVHETAFTEEDVATLQTMADQLANAIANARLFETANQRLAELEAIRQASLQVTSRLSLQPVLETILRHVLKLVSADDAHVFLYDGKRLSFGAAMWAGDTQQAPYSEPREHGITYSVARTGERIVVPAIKTHSLFKNGPWEDWDGAIVSLPLFVGDEVRGVMNVAYEEQHRFSEHELRVLELLADQAAIAIENARLYEGVQRYAEQLNVLHNIDLAITTTLDLEEVLQRVYEQITPVMDISAFHIALYDERQDELHFPLIVDQGKHMPPLTIEADDRKSLSSWVVHNREPLWIDDMEEERDSLPTEAITLGTPTRSLMVLPLIVRDEVIGVISVQSYDPYAFDQEHQRLFNGIASQVAVAVENARLFEETKHHLAETRLLQEVMQAAASTLDFDKMLTRAIETLHGTLGIESLSFASPDEHEDVMVVHPSMVGFPPPPGDVWRLPIDESIIGHVYQTGKPMLIADVRRIPHYFKIAPDTRSELAVPVRIGNEIIGVLNAERPLLAAFNEEDLRIFSAVATQLGMVLENARLYRTLQQQKDELSQAYGKLKDLDRLRAEVIQNVSHEFRTPFSLVQGYLDLLIKEDLGPLLDEQQNALQIIRKRTNTLSHLIQNLTMLEKATTDALQVSSVPISDIINQTLDDFRAIARQNDIVIQKDLPDDLPLVQGDQEQLKLVFRHLIDNAIKFSPGGGTVTVRGWTDDNWIHVAVTDEGIGIASENLDRIFERFYQVDGSTRRRFNGMGIGLALTMEIIEAHQGEVAVDSEPGKGSTFTISLPANQ